MSPLTFSLPVMYALVGFWSPLAILSNVSSEVEMTASASSPPSLTLTRPSLTSTVHFPAPSMSKRNELFIPAVFAGSTRVSRVSKNSRAFMRESLTGVLTRRRREALRRAGVVRCAGKVPLDQRMRQLPLLARELDPVALEL